MKGAIGGGTQCNGLSKHHVLPSSQTRKMRNATTAHGHAASNWQLNWKLSIPKAELKSLPSLAMAVRKVCPERIK